MLRIGICDDESHIRDVLKFSLEKLLRSDDSKVFYEFSSGEGLVLWAEKHRGEMDLLFLDIEMNGISGMEAAKQIRNFDTNLILVFVTGYGDFVFDGYSVQAMDYIMKPIKEEKLAQILERVKKQIEIKEPQTFTVQNADGLYRIPKGDILYFYSDKRIINLVTKDREYAFYGKMDDVENKIGNDFIRIHQRYLISARATHKLVGDSVQVGSASLPISRSLRQQVILKLSRLMLGDD